MKCVMVQGVTSGAGKTTVTALLCRHYAKRGIKVAPFKAHNLSLNSYVTSRGEEIGISQAFQAWACGLEPEGDMNPLLLKPKGDGNCQLIVSGKPYADIGRNGRTADRGWLKEVVKGSFDRLASKNDLIIIEGAGSPAEINLRNSDIANMTTADLTGAPVVLVGDIERGGVFAGLFGTYSLLQPQHRQRLKGFIINRFRGEPSILDSGIEQVSRIMGVPFVGTLPFADLRFPSEDSLDLGRAQGRGLEGSDARKAWLDNLDRFHQVSLSCLDFELMDNIIESGA